MFRFITISTLFAVMFLMAHSQTIEAQDTQKDVSASINKLNKAEVLKIMDLCTGSDKKKTAAAADSLGGVNKKISQEVTKDVFFAFGGRNNIDLKATKPFAVITCGGSNEFTISKAQPFEGDVFCFNLAGSNKFSGCTTMTFAAAKRHLK